MDQKKTPNLPFPWGCGPHLIHHGPTLLATRNGNSIASRTFTHSPHWLQWDAHIHPKIAPSHGVISIRVCLPHPWTQPTHHPKRHPDPISHFPQYTGDKACTNTAYLLSIDYSD